MIKHKILTCGPRRTLLGGPKERKARRACQKAVMAFTRVVLALTIHRFLSQQRQGKGKGNDGQYPQSGLSATEAPDEEGYGHAWESDDWSPSQWLDDSWTPSAGWSCTRSHTAWMVTPSLNLVDHPTHVVLDLGCTRSIGSRAAIERFKKHSWYYGITTELRRCNKSFVFGNSETEACVDKLQSSLSNNTTMFNHG